ncbi:SDR family NAD(P)-dependent oxidoreductase [Dactylosporangium sp. CA-139066]|uniref:SDR family NAD(P)-dependent oxidoreductase n=1 Tax=Dactylosporangium sp. CA-139066 TaxID=3239930 RepID=UPI003D941CEC
MHRLQGKTALVTGGTSGIGLAVARRFADEGAHVFVTGRRKETVDEAVALIGPSATGVAGDVTDQDDLDRLFATIGRRGRGLDVLMANAGGGSFAPLDAITAQDYRATFDRNVGGTLFTVQKALPLLRPGASIILTGSTAASTGTPAFGLYAATKAAIRSFGRTWAAELVDRGVRVNTLVPGPVQTPGLAGLAGDPSGVEPLFASLAAGVPLGRLGRPEEIAAAAVFLASDDSSFMTGAEIFVDGGAEQI